MPISHLQRCTLTGIDESTDFADIWALSDRYPFVEFGVLFSVTQSRMDTKDANRYPSIEWIEALAAEARQRPGPQFALHVCGRAVGDFLDVVNDGNSHGPYLGDIRPLLDVFGRIQLNLRAVMSTAEGIRNAVRHYPEHTFITQHNEANQRLTDELSGLVGHAVLFDQSGGRGVSPAAGWSAPVAGKYCGYAGGLGPANLAHQLVAIEAAANGHPYWVDMEGRLRDDEDQFDIARAHECLAIAGALLERAKTPDAEWLDIPDFIKHPPSPQRELPLSDQVGKRGRALKTK